MANRDEILRAVKIASEVTQEFPVSARTSFDLISVYQDMDIPVVFRPLDNLWGGAVSIQNENGVLIHSKLPRHLQRFTLAHELGHILLDHENKLDDKSSLSQRNAAREDSPTEEVSANRFASELLAPRELIRENAERLGWKKDQLKQSINIYQLSLRLGISFEATCWALVEHDLLSQHHADNYTTKEDIVKNIKTEFTPFGVQKNPWADVWNLKRIESGLTLEADENDLFFVKFEENSASGYTWTIPDKEDEVNFVHDSSEVGENYGSPSSRTFGFEFESASEHTVEFVQKRLWNDETIDQAQFIIDNRGRETKGLPRGVKASALEGTI